ncbi:MAG: AAA family ATPase, partial [Chitinispirillia bacterium]
MVLRKLNIFGFKSFANKTELSFGEGITAVIGPNGCGKSNVVDAIRWVLGEQKTSVLRSSNMQDVIFSGSEKYHPLNMAEVTLTIANNRGILPIEYNEIAITRRIFRSGESEYLINKTPSRLKDIHNMFLDTGLGSNFYTTIENAMINKILSDRTEERRTLFEEAAGIGRFKKRIKEGQNKLDRTKQDLLRINDRIQEKDRYVRILNRQVEKARRYKGYIADLKSLEVGLENRRYLTLCNEIKKRTGRINELETNIESLKARIAETESQIEKNELHKVEKESELQIASRNVSDAKEIINNYDREISVGNRSISFLKQNLLRFTQEINSITKQVTEKSELLKNIEKSIIIRERELEKDTVAIQEARIEVNEFEVRVLAQKEKVDELSARQLNLVHEIGEIQKELSNSRTNLTHCIERCNQNEDEIKRLQFNSEDYRLALHNCKKQLENANDAFKKHMKTRETLLKRIEKEDDLYHQIFEKEKQLEGQIDSNKSKLCFLEGLNTSYEGYNEGVKTLLQKKLPGTIGIVADLIDVDSPVILNLVERVLGTAIQTVVFDS